MIVHGRSGEKLNLRSRAVKGCCAWTICWSLPMEFNVCKTPTHLPFSHMIWVHLSHVHVTGQEERVLAASLGAALLLWKISWVLSRWLCVLQVHSGQVPYIQACPRGWAPLQGAAACWDMRGKLAARSGISSVLLHIQACFSFLRVQELTVLSKMIWSTEQCYFSLGRKAS